MHAPKSRILRGSNMRSLKHSNAYNDRDHSMETGRTCRGNFAMPGGKGHNALPNFDLVPRKSMKHLSANNRIENFDASGAGGNHDVFSRTQYDRTYNRLYNSLAQNAYQHPKGPDGPSWSKCC
jgi:hypothetical protein